MSVRQFLLKKFPKSKYYDCPIPKEYWGIMQEYADSECYDALEEYKAIELQNKVTNDPATPESTENWQKVGDKDKFMDEVRGKESGVSAMEILAKHSKNYKKWDNSEKSLFFLQVNGFEVIHAMEEYASIVNRKDNVGVNDAIEFAEWIHSNYNEVRGRLHGWRKRNIDGDILSTGELYLIFKAE